MLEFPNRKRVVISQPMYFPWVGLLEQIRLSDVFVHYDDVQYVRGFFNRVQIKTANGSRWLTVPIKDWHRGQLINEVKIDNSVNWRASHRTLLKHSYSNAKHLDEMLSVVDRVFAFEYETLSDLSIASFLELAKYFGLTIDTEFKLSSQMGIGGVSSKRLHNICVSERADVYITGHGARNYLDHELFEQSGIIVEYMDYQMKPYPQLYGEFTPYVSALDLIANCGMSHKGVISSDSKNWKSFLITSK
jgi:hypothetical protein